MQGVFDDRVSGSLRRNVQAFEDGHAGGDQRSEGSGKAGDGDLAHQDTEHRQFQHYGVNGKRPCGVPYQIFSPNTMAAKADNDQKTENAADEIAQADDDFGRQRQIDAQAREQRGENRNDFPQQQGDDASRHGSKRRPDRPARTSRRAST